MKYFFSLLLIFFAVSTSATELRFGGWSKHLNTNDLFNEKHHAYLLEHKNYIAGYFENSYSSETAVLGMYKRWEVTPDFYFGLTGGAMYGYRHCLKFNSSTQAKHHSKKVCPIVYPEVRWNAPLRPGLGLLGNAFVLTFGTEL